MDPLKTIHIIHATDADQHLGHLKKILDELKNEKRIDNYIALESDAITENSLNAIGAGDMVITLLTKGIELVKALVEETMHKAKMRLPQSKAGEIIIDPVPYDNRFIAFPSDLRPIRSREDMDGVWNTIGATLKKIFPPREEPEPPVIPVPWKKYLPYVLGALALILLFFLIPSIDDDDEDELKILSLNTSVTPVESPEGDCPRQFDFHGNVKINGPSDVVYTWLRSDGTGTSVDTLKFEAAGEKKILSSWTLGSDKKKYEEWQQLKIISPIDTVSNQANIVFECKGKAPGPTSPVIPTLSKVTVSAQVTGESKVVTDCGQRHKFNFSGVITTNGRGKVDFVWVGNDGKISSRETLVFQKSGSQRVGTSEILEANKQKYKGWKQLKIVSPSVSTSKMAEFLLACKATTPPVVDSGYMRNSILVRSVAKDAGVSTTLAENVLGSFVSNATLYLQKGAGISIKELGYLWVTSSRDKKTKLIKYNSSKPSAKVKYVDKTTLVGLMASDIGISKAEAGGIMDSFFRYVATRIKKGLATTLDDFGTWMVTIRPAREGRNPATGQVIKIEEKRVQNFKVDPMLTKMINN